MDFNKIRILSTMCLFIMYADIVLIMYLYDEYFKLWICFCYCSSLIISEKSYWNQHILYIFHGEISMLCKPNHTRFSLMSRYKTQRLKHIYTHRLIHIEKPKFLYEQIDTIILSSKIFCPTKNMSEYIMGVQLYK